jgi:hypothetical protein
MVATNQEKKKETSFVGFCATPGATELKKPLSEFFSNKGSTDYKSALTVIFYVQISQANLGNLDIKKSRAFTRDFHLLPD